MMLDELTYRIERQREGLVYVFDSEGDRVASVSRWMPGPMVHLRSVTIMSPAMALIVADAVTMVAREMLDDAVTAIANEILAERGSDEPTPEGGSVKFATDLGID